MNQAHLSQAVIKPLEHKILHITSRTHYHTVPGSSSLIPLLKTQFAP